MADTLATLHRLRRLQSDQAKRALADHLTAERTAEHRLAQAHAAIAAEAASAPTDAAHPLAHAFAAWLPAAHLARAQLTAALAAAEATTTTARATLTEARAAERAAESIAEKRATEARRLALKQDQLKSDDRPARQPASGGKGSAP
jgi:flagellar export protein FliJ